jgi:hypothetical protein
VPLLAILAAAPPAPAQADPVLAAAGDIACPPGAAVTATTCRHGPTSDLVLGQAPTAVAAVGDVQYNSATLAEFTGPGAFNDTWGRFKASIHPAPGNHEYNDNTGAGYFTYFGPAAGDPTKGYYSYDVGAWHIVSLNSNCSDAGCQNVTKGQVTTAEMQWLQADLAAHPAACTLAYWHHPRYSSGQVGDSPGVGPLWTALLDARADVVLNGHDHDYERFARQDGAHNATSDGIREFVVGTGGKSHFGFPNGALANSEVRDDASFGALFLTLHPTSYDWAFRKEDGTVADSGSTPCHGRPASTLPPSGGGQPPAPPAPSTPASTAPLRVGLRVLRPHDIRSVRRHGLLVRMTCSHTCRGTLQLRTRERAHGRRGRLIRIGRAAAVLEEGGRGKVRIRLGRAGRRLLRHAGWRRVSVVLTATDPRDDRRIARRALTLRRRS